MNMFVRSLVHPHTYQINLGNWADNLLQHCFEAQLRSDICSGSYFVRIFILTILICRKIVVFLCSAKDNCKWIDHKEHDQYSRTTRFYRYLYITQPYITKWWARAPIFYDYKTIDRKSAPKYPQRISVTRGLLLSFSGHIGGSLSQIDFIVIRICKCRFHRLTLK